MYLPVVEVGEVLGTQNRALALPDMIRGRTDRGSVGNGGRGWTHTTNDGCQAPPPSPRATTRGSNTVRWQQRVGVIGTDMWCWGSR